MSDNTNTISNQSEEPKSNGSDFKLEDTAKVNKNWNPLTSEPVAEKPYAKPLVNTNIDPKNIQDIPEPVFMPPKIDVNSVPPKPPLESTPINPQAPTLTPNEKKESAEMLADSILMGYERLTGDGAVWYVSVSEDRLLQDAIDGKISLDLAIPTNEDGTQSLSLKEFVTNFNQQAKEALRVHPEFKAKVRPILIRILEKHGFGMSDEMRLAVLVGEDILSRGIQVFALKKSINTAMGNFYKFYADMKSETVKQNTSESKTNITNNGSSQTEPEEATVLD